MSIKQLLSREAVSESNPRYERLYFRRIFQRTAISNSQCMADGKIKLVISKEILREYWRVGEIFADKFPSIDLQPILDLITIEAELYKAKGFPEPVCSDPDDDKFLTCAIASGSRIIISGDKHLIKVSGFHGIEILKPHEFVKKHLQKG